MYMLTTERARTQTIEVAGEELVLLPDRAAFWPARAALFVADVHFGKAAAFRAAMVPVPGGTTVRACERLTALIEEHDVRELYFLGDLWHAKEGRAPGTVETVAAWRERHADVQMTLVEGNHDRRSGALPAEFRMAEVREPFRLGPFALCHYPGTASEGYELSGHIHPCVQLFGGGGSALTPPCFWIRPNCAVLPAFGEFTGCARIQAAAGDRIFALADGRVIPVRLA